MSGGAKYAFNDGIVRYYLLDKNVDGGRKLPSTAFYSHYMRFNYIGVRQGEHWSARQQGESVECRIETLRDTRLKPRQVAVIDGEQYNVGRIFPGVNKQGVRITDVTLESPKRVYEVVDHVARE